MNEARSIPNNGYRPFPYRRMAPGQQPTATECEDALLLRLDTDVCLEGACSPLRELATLLSQHYRETEIAQLMGISRQKAARLRQHLRQCLESLRGDWGAA